MEHLPDSFSQQKAIWLHKIRPTPYITIQLTMRYIRILQGGGTPIHSVLRAATAVKMKVNSQFEIFSAVNSQATISL